MHSKHRWNKRNLKSLIFFFTTLHFSQDLDAQTHTDLHIVPRISSFSRDKPISIWLWWAESLFTEGQEAAGMGQEDQLRDAVGHSTWLLAKEYLPCWEVCGRHALCCASVSRNVFCGETSVIINCFLIWFIYMNNINFGQIFDDDVLNMIHSETWTCSVLNTQC